MKRGHSNIEADKTRRWDEIDAKVESGIACIPLGGGGSARSWKELPPLSLRREEWEQIGRKMGWLD